MTSRKLKIYPKYRPSSGHNDCLVPELRLSGQWLERSGFGIGDRVEILIRNQEIVIKPVHATVYAKASAVKEALADKPL